MADTERPDAVFRTGADAYDFFRERLTVGEGVVQVAHLDRAGRLLGVSIHAVTASDADLPIPAILREALTRDAAALLIAQRLLAASNPSDAAVAVTRRLAEAASGIGIRLLDRLAFAGDGCTSFRALERCERSFAIN